MTTATRTLRRSRAGLHGSALVGVCLSLFLMLMNGTPPLWLVAAVAALPAWAIAMVVGSGDRLALLRSRQDHRDSLDIVFVTPILALAGSVLQDFQFVDWWRPALLAIPLGVAALGLLANVSLPLRRPQMAFGVGLLLCIYAYGLLAQANVRLDAGAPTVFHASVLAKQSSSGYRGVAVSATISPWGPFATPRSATLRTSIYRSLRVGDTACVQLHKGALGAPWYEIEPCP